MNTLASLTRIEENALESIVAINLTTCPSLGSASFSSLTTATSIALTRLGGVEDVTIDLSALQTVGTLLFNANGSRAAGSPSRVLLTQFAALTSFEALRVTAAGLTRSVVNLEFGAVENCGDIVVDAGLIVTGLLGPATSCGNAGASTAVPVSPSVCLATSTRLLRSRSRVTAPAISSASSVCAP